MSRFIMSLKHWMSLTDFYTKAMAFVQQTLAVGWEKKDAVDLSLYQ